MGDGTCRAEILNCENGVTPSNITVGPGNCTHPNRPNAGITNALAGAGPTGPWSSWGESLRGGNDNGLRALPNGTLHHCSLFI
eukprot:m.5881 g.5881  ORF g.5881 m.5881 type:complete len:83 (+) comp3759_c0_seq1:472-720(+)